MKRITNIGIAITCTLAITACQGTLESDEVTLDEAITNSTYRQALHPDGNIDCGVLHNALNDAGINPAMLDPNAVFDACVNSGQVGADTCQAIADGCFGPENCGDGDHTVPPQPQPGPDSDICDMVFQIAGENGVDSSTGGVDVLQACLDQNFDSETCMKAAECFVGTPGGSNGGGGGTPSADMCQTLLSQSTNDVGADGNRTDRDSVVQSCLDQGYDDQLCETVVDACGPDGNGSSWGGGADGTDPNGMGGDGGWGGAGSDGNIDCAEVQRIANEQGWGSNNTDASTLFDECVQQTNDAATCQAVLACLAP